MQRVAFKLGDSVVNAQVRQFGNGKQTLVNLHDDEQTSVDAAVQVLEKRGGRLIELTHSGKRRVVFTLNGKDYSFDPNRIFTPVGVRKTVQGENPIPEEAYRAVEQFGSQFIRYFKLNKQPALIALHNNGDADDFSIHSYEPGREYGPDTAELHIDAKADPDDFYFVTDKRLFDYFRNNHFNVMLQDNSIPRDDGSLSVFAGRHRIPYANVEAQPDHLQDQIRMIEAAMGAMNAIRSAP